MSYLQYLCSLLFSVSIGDVEAVREGHQSETLLSMADVFPAERCFTLVFRGRKGNLDLVAESAEEANAWIQGIRALMENMENMDESTKNDQYPCYKNHNFSLFKLKILYSLVGCLDHFQHHL